MSAKRKSFTSLAKPVIRQSPKVATKSRIDESRTAVTTGFTPKSASKPAKEEEIASDSPSPSDEEEASEDETESKPQKPRKAGREVSKSKAGQDLDADTDMTSPKPDDDQEQSGESDSEEASPTFGDLVRGTSTVDVSSTLAAQAPNALARTSAQPRSIVPISSTSLGTVLNQALKSDDRDLLESCLQVHDVKIVQSTINRMDSALACTLLTKLADRMHRRPGRALSLMRWMQWTLIAHGGTLVTQPGLVDKLDNLRRVLEERARGLPKLLALKGKLEMLDQQMQFRRAIKNAKLEGSDGEESDNPDEPGVVYVEGDDEIKGLTSEIRALTNGARGKDEDDDFTGANGLNDESDDESDESDDDDDDLVDELADVESLDEDEVDHDDVEDESGEDEEEEEGQDDEDNAPPAKVQKLTSKAGKRK